jgi:hypothetical protein
MENNIPFKTIIISSKEADWLSNNQIYIPHYRKEKNSLYWEKYCYVFSNQQSSEIESGNIDYRINEHDYFYYFGIARDFEDEYISNLFLKNINLLSRCTALSDNIAERLSDIFNYDDFEIKTIFENQVVHLKRINISYIKIYKESNLLIFDSDFKYRFEFPIEILTSENKNEIIQKHNDSLASIIETKYNESKERLLKEKDRKIQNVYKNIDRKILDEASEIEKKYTEKLNELNKSFNKE